MRTTRMVALIAVLSGCGASEQPPAAEPAMQSRGEEGAQKSPPAAAPTGESSAPPPSQTSESETLASDLLKRGGRRIGWSDTKKGFVHPMRRRTGQSASLDIVFTDEAGRNRDVMRVCQAGECDEHMAELVAQTTPKLSARLDAEGYVAIRAIGWPSGRDELDVDSLGMKLRSKGGRIEAIRQGKPAAALGTVKPPRLLAVFPVPNAKLLGVVSSPEGDPDDETFSVLRLP